MLAEKDQVFLKNESNEIRKLIIRFSNPELSNHFGGPFSSVEIMTYLYMFVMKDMDLSQKERDKLILSKGHCCPTFYALLGRRGYLSEEELHTYKKLNSPLQVQPDMKRLPFVDFSSGSLGQGLSVAVGMAIANKMKNSKNNIYVILGDGEIQEGQIWEAAMAASKYRLDNIICFLDKNNLQSDGNVCDVMPIEPVAKKWEAFGWFVTEADGHDFCQIDQKFKECSQASGVPKMIVCNTVKGKGVSFMENKYEWHSKILSNDMKLLALKELEGMVC
ncbi:transketolase [Ruminiclostridium cellobioparum]|uniref:Transketolase, N-terminal subunit n=1 Tax=Ruminiclostridium cellobioparum subsp. termitidis CT1112 TaxID=1195236 RepID=S0FHL8_RUMCE|nr:transketolase [Ruminiclostridium cellobioparum]EMS69401.1 Transketolase, N-terminal subunit [Ruminiclostridium cellobioparum subsp. termitidis CT1112]